MKMKRSLIGILSLALVFSLAGCGKKDTNAKAPKEETKVEEKNKEKYDTEKDISDNEKVMMEKMDAAKKILMDFLKLEYNYTPNNVKEQYGKVKSMVTDECAKDFDNNIKKIQESKETNKLIRVTIIETNAAAEGDIEGVHYKPGDCITITSEVIYEENGKEKTDKIINSLIYKDGKWVITGEKTIK